MVDKITGGKGFGPLDSVKRGKSGAGAKAGSGDKVSFSSVLQDTSKAQAAKSAQDPARVAKLQALKEQIDSGTYRPDLEKVAASLLPFLMKDA